MPSHQKSMYDVVLYVLLDKCYLLVYALGFIIVIFNIIQKTYSVVCCMLPMKTHNKFSNFKIIIMLGIFY